MSSKNLVIIHLESVSHEVLHKFSREFPALNHVMSRSKQFTSFFSSATSSIMGVSDFLYGDTFEIDHFTCFDENVGKIRNMQCNLFSLLRQAGYCTGSIGYPRIWRDDLSNFGIWDTGGEVFRWVNTYDIFCQYIDKFLADSDHPFALYVWNQISHLHYTDAIKQQGTTAYDQIRIGYSCLNDTVAYIWQLLEKRGLLDNTIILGFGDHGDDFWTHSLNGGFCHGVEPYSNLIWNPMFIYNFYQEPGLIDELASLVDLKRTCLGLVGVKDPDQFAYGGIDLFHFRNKVVYSQNLCANQQPNKFLTKSFSATNDRYHMIVSERGLELYNFRLDPTNHNNLLNFFDIKGREEMHFNNRGATHVHFSEVFSEDQIKDIKTNYRILLNSLMDRVRLKNEMLAKEKRRFLFDMGNFIKIKPRKYYWRNVNYFSIRNSIFCAREELKTFLKNFLLRCKHFLK